MLEKLIDNATALKEKLNQDNMVRGVAIQQRIEQEVEQKKSWLSKLYDNANNLNLPSLADLLNTKSGNPLMNYKGIFPERPMNKVVNDPEALQRAQESQGRQQRFLGMMMQAAPVLGQMMGGAGVASPMVKSKDVWNYPTKNFLAQKLPGQMPAPQLAQTLTSWLGKGNIKREEVEWSGLVDWVGEQKGKVTKEEVLGYLDENNVQIEEVEKGIGSINPDDITVKIRNASATQSFAEVSYKGKDIYGGDIPVEPGSTADEIRTSAMDWLRDPNQTGTNTEIKDLTKFSKWVTPGGENYRELLLKLPRTDKTNGEMALEMFGKKWSELSGSEMDKIIQKSADSAGKDQYRGSHWEEPNVLAHIRFDERTGQNGEKILHIAEIQSDWHQEGRKAGYASDKPKHDSLPKGYDVKSEKEPERPGEISNVTRYWVEDANGERVSAYGYNRDSVINGTINDLNDAARGTTASPVPDAPFKKTWPMLTMKRMVRYAAENGFDSVSWDTGEVQADRYDLSKQVDEVVYFPATKDLQAFKDGNEVIYQKNVAEEKLEDYIGKEAAQRLIDNPTEKTVDGKGGFNHTLSGTDLKVGGEGMKGFYDKILPSEVNKFFNKKAWGNAKVGERILNPKISTVNEDIKMLFGEGKSLADLTNSESKRLKQYYEDMDKGGNKEQKAWTLKITPEMKSKALTEGMPISAIDKQRTTANA